MSRIKWRTKDDKAESTPSSRSEERSKRRMEDMRKRLEQVALDMAEELDGKPMFMYVPEDESCAVIAVVSIGGRHGIGLFLVPTDTKKFRQNLIDEYDHYFRGVDLFQDMKDKKSHVPAPRKNAIPRLALALSVYDSMICVETTASWKKHLKGLDIPSEK